MPEGFEAGVLLVDKPPGPTSFRMVQLVRRALKIKKVGHTGTLDPFASGLLIICFGRPATKMISQLMAGEKVYEAVLKLGVETDTLDIEGDVISRQPVGQFDSTVIENCLEKYRGEQFQSPPAFSAVKHKGKPLYHYARKGEKIEKEPRRIFIRELRCVSLEEDQLTLLVKCSKGTYIRTLAADIGKELGCGGHLIGLRRLENGPFSVSEAVPGTILDTDSEEDKARLLSSCFTVERAMSRVAQAADSMSY